MARSATHRLSPAPRRTGGPARRRRLFEEALAVIERDYHSELTIEQLARSIFASRRQLQRVFAEAGTSVSAVLHRVRMDHAAELLGESRLSIEEVGRAVGYREASQFAKAFKRRHGITPSRWREMTTVAGTDDRRSKAVAVSLQHPLRQRRRSPHLHSRSEMKLKENLANVERLIPGLVVAPAAFMPAVAAVMLVTAPLSSCPLWALRGNNSSSRAAG